MNATKGTLVPFTAHPWAWAIFLTAAECELLMALLMLAQPKELLGIPREWVSEPAPMGVIPEAA